MNYHICLSCDDKYLKYAAVLMYSIVKEAQHSQRILDKEEKFVFHIISSDIPQSALYQLKVFEYSLNQFFKSEIIYEHVDSSCFKDFPGWGEGNNHTTYLRLLIDKIFPQDFNEKILYLDCDMVCSGDLRELFYLDLKDNIVAAVPDIFHEACRSRKLILKSKNKEQDFCYHYQDLEVYFNAGMLLIDLAKWKEFEVGRKTIEYLNKYHVPTLDQDVLNAVLHSKALYVEFKWNCMWWVLFDNKDWQKRVQESINTQSEFIQALIKPYMNHDPSNMKILHLTSSPKPWQNGGMFIYYGMPSYVVKEFNDFWIDLAKTTPVYNDDLIEVIDKSSPAKVENYSLALGKFIRDDLLSSIKRIKKRGVKNRNLIKILFVFQFIELILIFLLFKF